MQRALGSKVKPVGCGGTSWSFQICRGGSAVGWSIRERGEDLSTSSRILGGGYDDD